ncbi:uncharacterized protein [Halyomorpha halys]|uniref:uncharacterized protein n=1 Tax=Halyomorpha halys TaxID=286706 RepID=UPI0034D36E42
MNHEDPYSIKPTNAYSYMRYRTFAFCMTIKAITPDEDIFSEAVAVAVSYDLPYNSTTLGVSPPHVQSRTERSVVYSKLERILDKLGVPGNQCILRAICEGAQQLSPGEGMLTEILRTILMFPEEEPSQYEPKEQWRYLGARRAGLLNYNCPDLYPHCSISFVQLFTTLKPVIP